MLKPRKISLPMFSTNVMADRGEEAKKWEHGRILPSHFSKIKSPVTQLTTNTK